MASTELDLASLAAQQTEVAHGVAMLSDLEYAYQLQLNEVLLASSAACPGFQNTPSSSGGPLADPQSDFSLALNLQRLELRQSQEDVLGSFAAAAEAEKTKELLKMRVEDRKLAQEIEHLEDYESENVSVASANVDWNLFTLYFCGWSIPEPANPDSRHYGMGVLLVDPDGIAVLELGKYVNSGKGGKVASYHMALLDGLASCLALGARHVFAYCDSLPMYNTVKGYWTIRSKKVQSIWNQSVSHIEKLQRFEVKVAGSATHLSRIHKAERLARDAIHAHFSKLATDNCSICLEDKFSSEMYVLERCFHKFCRDCVARHGEVKISNNQVPIPCPHVGCSNTLITAECKVVLSSKYFVTLVNRLAEKSIPESERVYCPFPKCSALMDCRSLDLCKLPGSSSNPRQPMVNCIACARPFCVDCRVPWHANMSCKDYQQLSPSHKDAEDAMLYNLAQHKKWKRCKKCRRMIELDQGCYHMTCRCGYEFCYVCEAEFKNKKQTCHCKAWDVHNIIRDPDEDEDEDDEDYDSEDDYESEYLDETEYEEEEEEEEEEDDDDDDDDDDTNDNVSHTERPRAYKTQLCKYWEIGCRLGDDCNFAHGIGELRPRYY